ncbi:MAG: hypothetical protein V4731_12645 [Pseudomonadota bacterium]
MSKLITAIFLCLTLLQAQADENDALNAVAADAATTALALSAGLTELNPLGAIGSIIVKAGTMAIIKDMPETQRPAQYNMVSALWSGAAASNLCWLTGAGPACFLVGYIRSHYVWNAGADERTFWAMCEGERRVKPDLKCVWKIDHV